MTAGTFLQLSSLDCDAVVDYVDYVAWPPSAPPQAAVGPPAAGDRRRAEPEEEDDDDQEEEEEEEEEDDDDDDDDDDDAQAAENDEGEGEASGAWIRQVVATDLGIDLIRDVTKGVLAAAALGSAISAFGVSLACMPHPSRPRGLLSCIYLVRKLAQHLA